MPSRQAASRRLMFFIMEPPQVAAKAPFSFAARVCLYGAWETHFFKANF
jgi:hypothetical protein